MSTILYTSLVKLPQPVENIQQALELIYTYVKKPDILTNIKSEIVFVDSHHINIIRHFKNLAQYQEWIFSTARDQADEILIQTGFYLYTKQAHNELR